MVYMHEFTAFLAYIFPSLSADHMPFPVPPTWPEDTSLNKKEEQNDVDEDMTDIESGEFRGSSKKLCLTPSFIAYCTL